MGLFTRRCHDSEFIAKLLQGGMRSMHKNHDPYAYAVRPSLGERARAELALVLLPVAIANAFLHTKQDARITDAFIGAFELYFSSFPTGSEPVEVEYFVVWPKEIDEFQQTHRRKFVSETTPELNNASLMDLGFVMRVLSAVRNKQYLADTHDAMTTSARAGLNQADSMLRAFRFLAESFMRQIFDPAQAVTPSLDEPHPTSE